MTNATPFFPANAQLADGSFHCCEPSTVTGECGLADMHAVSLEDAYMAFWDNDLPEGQTIGTRGEDGGAWVD